MRHIKTWTLYCHTHIESGRRYIGLTSHTMMHRWAQHICQARYSKGGRWHFPNAIRKYGKDAFSHEVLAQSWTLEGANATEEALILQYDTRNPEKGFNLTKGGEHTPHPIRKNPWNNPTFREKMALVIVKMNDRSWKDRSDTSKEVNSRFEVRKKLSAATSIQFSSLESRQSQSDLLKKLHLDPEIHTRFQKGLITANRNRADRMHCANGHEFSPENMHVDRNGWRVCRACKRKEWRRRNPPLVSS
jgi:hypothetical protein